MIAKDVGIDISTLHYHWGDKKDLYEAVIIYLNEKIRMKLIEIEEMVHGKPLATRFEVAIDVMYDYLIEHPEAANLMLLSYFSKTRPEDIPDRGMAEHVTNIAIAMGLAPNHTSVSPQANARVLAVFNSVINFASGESLFRPMLNVNRADYIAVVKETLKFILIPAFTADKR